MNEYLNQRLINSKDNQFKNYLKISMKFENLKEFNN